MNCATCGLEYVNAILSYRLKVLVSDSNEKNIFILDDVEVSQIFNKECSNLLQDNSTLTEGIHELDVLQRLIQNQLKWSSISMSKCVNYWRIIAITFWKMQSI
ncbi:hypothetical protein PIB30_027460 [Stylosanthes scabra]|uniref:Uncharacterized protein n=1 Tax=Stylosanthes scabra TaxID=79078 RepID=A0ABU6ZAB5_9FABA|nr:hypothetical protein [Stylosanthes scabra]